MTAIHATLLLLTIPFIIFSGLLGPVLFEAGFAWLYLLCLALAVAVLGFLLRTWISDPGIVPSLVYKIRYMSRAARDAAAAEGARAGRVLAAPDNEPVHSVAREMLSEPGAEAFRRRLLGLGPAVLRAGDEHGRSLLHIAAHAGDAAACAALLDAGARPDARDHFRLLPTHYAALGRHMRCAERLHVGLRRALRLPEDDDDAAEEAAAALEAAELVKSADAPAGPGAAAETGGDDSTGATARGGEDEESAGAGEGGGGGAGGHGSSDAEGEPGVTRLSRPRGGGALALARLPVPHAMRRAGTDATRALERAGRGRAAGRKHCRTCLADVPDRAHHCRDTDVCVREFDHFCPWVGNTVGERNHRHFLGFVFSVATLCAAVAAACFVCIVHAADSQEGAWPARFVSGLSRSPLSGFAAVLAVFVLCVGMMTTGMSWFHVSLVCQNTTTYEEIRHGWMTNGSPHSRGPCRNTYARLCAPVRPSEIAREEGAWSRARRDSDDGEFVSLV